MIRTEIRVIDNGLSPIEQEVQHIRMLLQRNQHGEVAHASAKLLEQEPGNREALYMLAVSQRCLRNIGAALGTLETLRKHHPNFSRLYQERGYCHVALKEAPEAVDAFLRSLTTNPSLTASWSMLESLYRLSGDFKNADMAADQAAALKKIPPEIVMASSLFADGDWAPAERLARDYLMKHGNHVEAMRLLARIGIERSVFDDAEILLESVLIMAPNYIAARVDYARVLLERQKHLQASEQLEKLLQVDPADRVCRTLYAAALAGRGEHEKALSIYLELLPDAQQPAEIHLSIGHALKTLGRQVDSVEAYRSAAASRADYGDAYWSLANLKTYVFSKGEITQMHSAEAAQTTQLADRYHLCFALGKAYEDQGEYGRSFELYQRGNALKRSAINYRPENMEANTRRQIEVCTSDFFERRRNFGNPTCEPIFIVGLPRAGSTLLEQILASHSTVEGTQELPDVQRIAFSMQGRDGFAYPDTMCGLVPDDVLTLSAQYLAAAKVFRTGKPRFIDKMPNNFRHVGLIHLMLPNCRIIDARREPMGCCLSNLKQLFANGQEFSYSVDDVARYYRTYLDLMRHWDEVLPGKILRVVHEDVVENLEGSVRRILEFCGLEFEPACLQFYKTERSVRTASSEQVRRPINREGLDQWKNFKPYLSPLVEALGDALETYRN